MPSTRDIRRRIRSVKSTAQITKAMQMVASSKMKRAQDAALAGRPYAVLMNSVLGEVIEHSGGDLTHPLMERREVRKRALVVVSTDKGLCGALNSNVARELLKFDTRTTMFVTVGRKASQFIARTRRQLAAEFTYSDTPRFAEARAIARAVREMFLKGEVDAVEVLFTRFVNTLSQTATVIPLLPVVELTRENSGLKMVPSGQADAEGKKRSDAPEFLFEPSPQQVLGDLLPHWVNFLMYQVLLEAKASEHSARMVAMKNATDNAKSLIKDLTLEYNKMRQAMITKELLEISSAAMALG
jgi:F-type H+-transporting ATPase subunit gamma